MLDFPPHLLATESMDLFDCRDVYFYSDILIVSYRQLNLVCRFRDILKLPLLQSLISISSLSRLTLESLSYVPNLTNPGVILSLEYLGVSCWRQFVIDTELSCYVVLLLLFLLFYIDVLLFLRVNLRWDWFGIKYPRDVSIWES